MPCNISSASTTDSEELSDTEGFAEDCEHQNSTRQSGGEVSNDENDVDNETMSGENDVELLQAQEEQYRENLRMSILRNTLQDMFPSPRHPHPPNTGIEMIPVDCLEDDLLLDLFGLHIFQGEASRASMDSLLDCFNMDNNRSRDLNDSNAVSERSTPTNPDPLTPPKAGLAWALRNMCQTPTSPDLPPLPSLPPLPNSGPFSPHRQACHIPNSQLEEEAERGRGGSVEAADPIRQGLTKLRLLNMLEQYRWDDRPRTPRLKNCALLRPPPPMDASTEQGGRGAEAVDSPHQPPPPYNPLWATRTFPQHDPVHPHPIGSPRDRPVKDEQSYQRKDDSLPEERRSSSP